MASSRLCGRTLTLNTSGRTRVAFTGYNADGSFSYTFKATSIATEYVARTFVTYTDDMGEEVTVYSEPITIAFNAL